IVYHTGDEGSCLVEADEEPPHRLNMEAVESALLVGLALKTVMIDEIHVMRKMVIDGSNPAGFQRTAILGVEGILSVGERNVKVQTICLEEDAARLLRDKGNTREFDLNRLGVPLVEVALEPIKCTGREVEGVALALGRLLRSTKRVARGLGTIRQDVNISLQEGRIVEIKGIQKLGLISKVIEYETERQKGLLKIRDLILQKIPKGTIDIDHMDVTSSLSKTKSPILRKSLDNHGIITALKIHNFSGVFGFEPAENIRLGKELAELARSHGLGGVFHSDELPGYGITVEEVTKLRLDITATKNDAFLLVTGAESRVREAAKSLEARILSALDGVPSETRAATEDGQTRFMRPKPGPARMYPETDVPPMQIDSKTLERLRNLIPKSWEEQVGEYKTKYRLSDKLSLQIYDSDYLDLFVKVTEKTSCPPSFVAATLTETIIGLNRTGQDSAELSDLILFDLFNALDEGKISKDLVPKVLELLMKGDAAGVREAIKVIGIKPMSDSELQEIIQRVLEGTSLIRERGEGSFEALMGEIMKEVRGRIEGSKVSAMLRKEIDSKIGRV
ncbi:MAG: Glu-tRNA(Gln) amidotransferase subunit GatE, partial [Thaumarchaeota archaeon]|nr:Glu-tRNA(Gln) amidotransferase subunit GatE [Nitrososphaerota archaeon]